MNRIELEYRIVRRLFGLLGMVPPFPQILISRFLANIVYALDKKHRLIMIDNLTRAFGREKSRREIIALAKAVLAHFIRGLFEIGWISRLSADDFLPHLKVEGLEHYTAALKQNRGVFALTAHLGNWELLPAAASVGVHRPGFVYRPMDNKPLDMFFIDQRTRFGAVMFPTNRAMRKVLRLIAEGGTAVLLMDQSVSWQEGVFADFFGHPACTNKGLALMALKTKAPVVPVFLVREGDGFVLKFGPVVPLIDTGDKTGDVEENTRQYNQVIEEIIRQYPDQWFWVHQRWKSRPYRLLSERPAKRRKKHRRRPI